MKKILFALLTVPFFTFGQGSQDFENAGIPAGSVYVDGSFTEAGITYNYFHCRDQDTFDITNLGLMLRRASDSYFEWTIPNGVGNLEFQYRKAFSGSADRQLEVIANTDTITTPIFGSGSGGQDTIYTFSHNFDLQGSVTIKIKNVGTASTNKQAVIDNILWTGFGGGTPDPECDAPTNLSISNVGENSADLTWTPGGSGQTFEIVYGPAPLDPESGGQTVTSSNPNYTLINLTPDTEYEVYVRAICSDTVSVWLDGTFTTDAESVNECSAPSNVSVSNISTTTADVSWTSNGTETIWEIHYGESGSALGDYDVVTVSTNPFQIINLTEDTEYNVFVVAVCDTDTGDKSVPSDSTTFVTEKESSIAKEAFTNFTYYPNPVSDNLNLKADNKIEKVEIYNVLGEAIQAVMPNATDVNINTSNLSKGIYLVKVSIGNSNETYRIIKK